MPVQMLDIKGELEVSYQTTTNSTLTYTFERNGEQWELKRKLVTAEGAENEVETTIEDIRSDGQALLNVAKILESMAKAKI